MNIFWKVLKSTNESVRAKESRNRNWMGLSDNLSMGWEMVLKNQAENINLFSLSKGRQQS